MSAEAKVETTPQTVLPEAGRIYTDSEGRSLRVEAFDLTDSQGSQVKGKVWGSREPRVGPGRAFSTTLAIWKRVWYDKAPCEVKGKGWLG